MANNAFGIDLGTNNIKIYNRNDDNIMIEKNMIAIENKNTLFAYGNSAFEMYEKAPSNIHISYPLSNGVIAEKKYGDFGEVFYRRSAKRQYQAFRFLYCGADGCH